MRAALGILLSWYVFKLLSVFRLESRINIERIERLESIIRERQRIANDIHDGAIQSIYGAGMLLDRASELIDSDHQRSKIVIDQVIFRLNETIDSLRRYILDLKSEDLNLKDVQQRFKHTIKQYREAFPQMVIYDSIQLPIWFILVPGAADHTYFILQEAIANAAQHAKCSQINVKMVGNEHTLDIEICDNGIGISKDIFQNNSFGGLHGNGILSMEQRARQLSSKLNIKSDQTGTTLVIQIERRRLQLKKYKLMVVDDHDVVRMGIIALLEDSEFEVINEARSVAETLEKVAWEKPDIILMDVRLPDGSGIDACRQIVQNYPDVRVLILTSYADDDAVLSSIQAGASG